MTDAYTFQLQSEVDKKYAEQRCQRLDEAISDYLMCEDTNPRQCYDELVSSIEDTIAYHDLHRSRAQTLLNLITDGSVPLE